MADNVGYTPGTGATVAADDIGGVLYQRIKIGIGADGAATDLSSANPMPVIVDATTPIATKTTTKWAQPSARSGNFAGTTLNSLATGTESAVVTYDNSLNRDLYGILTIKLGSITPTTGASIAVRVTLNDGTDTADRLNGDIYLLAVSLATGAKILMVNMVRLYPVSMRISIQNNTGVAFATSGNELYLLPWNEQQVG